MSRRSQRRSTSANVRVALAVLVSGLFMLICFCLVVYAAFGSLFDGEESATPSPQSALIVAYSPEKALVFRTLVEQFNGHLKENVLDECWLWPKGLAKKAAMVMAGLICYNAEAMRSLVAGDKSLKTVSKYWA